MSRAPRSRQIVMTLHHQIAIRAPRAAVYSTIAEPAQIGRWWGAQTPVQTQQGLELEHQAGPYGTVRLRVVELRPDTRIEWTCIGDYPPDNPAAAWVGTHFIFELSSGDSGAARVERACSPAPIAELTTVDFRQTGYDLRGRFAGFNNNAWGQVLQALKEACEPTASTETP